MDQKRAMLYPEFDTARNAMPQDQRISASAAIGLPTEAPPSYDMAMASTSSSAPPAASANVGVSVGVGGGWQPPPSAPLKTPESNIVQQPIRPTHGRHQTQPHDEQPPHTRPVIVVQPQPQTSQLQHDLVRDAAPQPTALPPKLGPNPCAVLCPACGANKTTRMQYTSNTRTHLCAVLLCLVGWCCCACTVPYCMNSCRTGSHYCAKCNTFLGVYDPRKHK